MVLMSRVLFRLLSLRTLDSRVRFLLTPLGSSFQVFTVLITSAFDTSILSPWLLLLLAHQVGAPT